MVLKILKLLKRLFKRRNHLVNDRIEYISGIPVKIGKYTYGINWMSILVWDKENASVEIGRFCSISYGLKIFTGGNHNSKWISTYPFGHVSPTFGVINPIKGHPRVSRKVKIGNDVWIGRDVTIMSGVEISDGVIIAANSHVIKNAPPYSIIGGNPAQIISYRFNNDIIKQLLDLQWWNWADEKIMSEYKNLVIEPELSSLLKAD